MRIISYARKDREKGYSGTYFYIPDQEVVFVAEKRGNQKIYDLSDDREVLVEAQAVSRGEIPNSSQVDISDVMRYQTKDEGVLDLIRDARGRIVLEARVISGILEMCKVRDLFEKK